MNPASIKRTPSAPNPVEPRGEPEVKQDSVCEKERGKGREKERKVSRRERERERRRPAPRPESEKNPNAEENRVASERTGPTNQPPPSNAGLPCPVLEACCCHHYLNLFLHVCLHYTNSRHDINLFETRRQCGRDSPSYRRD